MSFIQAEHKFRKVTLQLNWLHQFQFAGYYIAKEKGFYKDVGIDIDIKEFQYGMDISNVIEDKKVDFAIGRSSLLIEKAKKKDVVALFATFQDSPLMLLTREDSKIKTLNDLKSKNIMMTPDAKTTASILAMLSSQKIYENDINVQDHTFDLNDLISGKTDAMASYLSNEPIILDDKGIKYKIFHSKDYGFSFYDDILFTSSSFINKNPKLTKAFYEATIKGWNYAFSNIGLTSQLIYRKYNSQKKSLIHLVREGEILKKLALTDSIKVIGTLDENKLQKIIDVYKVMGLMKKDINFDEFIYKHNNHMPLSFKLSEKEIIIYTLIAFLVFVTIIFAIIYISIRRKWLHTTDKLSEEIKIKTLQLEEQNHLDYLTDTKNRKAYAEKILEHLALFKRYKNSFSLLMFDIDNFKKVNDTYGHKTGDKVLIELVNIINNNIRENDFLFRVGGEEFVIILSETNLECSKIVAEHLRGKIEDNLRSQNDEVVTVSIGVSEVLKNDDEESLYSRVDLLLYTSKREGKNKVSF